MNVITYIWVSYISLFGFPCFLLAVARGYLWEGSITSLTYYYHYTIIMIIKKSAFIIPSINLYYFIFTTHMVLLLHFLSSSLFPKNIQLGIFVLIALGGEA